MRSKRLLLFPLLLATGVACGPSSLEPLPLEADLAASVNPAAVNQEVQFTINAQGSNLLSLVLNYGDGTNDDLQSIVGSRTARWVNPHTFVTAGQYTVTATINELSDTTSRTITMTVNPVAGTSTSIPRVFDVK